MTFYSNVKQKSYVLNPRGKPLYEGMFWKHSERVYEKKY